jgi:hypothetical protein
VGTLDDPGKMPPDVHIFTGSRLPWYSIPEDVPAVESYYVRKTTWSQDNQRRLRALCEQIGVAYG